MPTAASLLVCLFPNMPNRRNDDSSSEDKKERNRLKKERKKAKTRENSPGMDVEAPASAARPDPGASLPAPAAPPVPANVSNGDIFKLIQSLSAKVDKIDVLSERMGEMVVNQTNTSKHLAGVESRLDSLDARVIMLEDNKSMPASSSKRWGEMPEAGIPHASTFGSAHPHHVWGSKERGASGSAFPPTPPNGSSLLFDRPGRPHVIQCNTQDGVLVTKVVVQEFFQKALVDKGLACELVVNCRFDTDKRFTVVFNAPGNVGYECVQSLLRSKKKDGQWREFFVASPSSAQVQLHFDPDKGPKQVKLEITTQKFTKILKGKYGEAKFYCRKDAGKIFMEGAPIACISVSERDADLEWFKRTIGSSGIDKEAMRTVFKETFCEEWCS